MNTRRLQACLVLAAASLAGGCAVVPYGYGDAPVVYAPAQAPVYAPPPGTVYAPAPVMVAPAPVYAYPRPYWGPSIFLHGRIGGGHRHHGGHGHHRGHGGRGRH